MTQSIFSIDGSDLTSLSPGQFRDENELQELLGNHPQLLGNAVASGPVVRLLLVGREVGIPDTGDGGNRWPIDHVFIDQNGVPVLVEVKRSANPELRRKIVGQLLEYAANGPRYWPPRRLRDIFEERCEREGLDADALPGSELDPDIDQESLWIEVDDNLRNGRLRLVFVADQIPSELASIIEFLGEQMTPTEVLGVELHKFQAEDGTEILSPRVIGPTEAGTTNRKNRGESRGSQEVDDIGFYEGVMPQANYEALRAAFDAVNKAVAERDLPWAPRLYKWRISWHRPGAGTGTFMVCEIDAKRREPIRFGFRLPADPDQLDGGLSDPFPELNSRWEYEKWQWEIPDPTLVPDLGQAIDLCSGYHQGTGPTAAPPK